MITKIESITVRRVNFVPTKEMENKARELVERAEALTLKHKIESAAGADMSPQKPYQ